MILTILAFTLLKKRFVILLGLETGVDSLHYLIGPFGCPLCAGAPVSVLEAVLEPGSGGQRAVGAGTCSCRWAGSVCVPPQTS